jgi:hypothetical protein
VIGALYCGVRDAHEVRGDSMRKTLVTATIALAALVLAGGVSAVTIKPLVPTLTGSITDVSASGYTFRVTGTNYPLTQPGGAISPNCKGQPGSLCGPLPEVTQWIGGATDDNGGFFVDFPMTCPSVNVKSWIATDNDGVTSKGVKPPC